jgi:hypothetical protein
MNTERTMYELLWDLKLHSGWYRYYCLLGYDAAYSGRKIGLSTFRMNLLPLYSTLKRAGSWFLWFLVPFCQNARWSTAITAIRNMATECVNFQYYIQDPSSEPFKVYFQCYSLSGILNAFKICNYLTFFQTRKLIPNIIKVKGKVVPVFN